MNYYSRSLNKALQAHRNMLRLLPRKSRKSVRRFLYWGRVHQRHALR